MCRNGKYDYCDARGLLDTRCLEFHADTAIEIPPDEIIKPGCYAGDFTDPGIACRKRQGESWRLPIEKIVYAGIKFDIGFVEPVSQLNVADSLRGCVIFLKPRRCRRVIHIQIAATDIAQAVAATVIC